MSSLFGRVVTVGVVAVAVAALQPDGKGMSERNLVILTSGSPVSRLQCPLSLARGRRDDIRHRDEGNHKDEDHLCR